MCPAHIRPDPARVNRTHDDAISVKLLRERLHHLVHRGLRASIGVGTGTLSIKRTHLTRDRHHAWPRRTLKVGSKRGSQTERSQRVNLKRLSPRVIVNVIEAMHIASDDSGVVQEHIYDFARKFGHKRRHHLAISDVELRNIQVGAVLADLQGIRVSTGRNHSLACPQKPPGEREPDPAVSAGDDCRFHACVVSLSYTPREASISARCRDASRLLPFTSHP